MIVVGGIMVALGLLAVMWAMAEMAAARRLVRECKQQPRDASGRFAKAPKPTVVKALAMREQFGMAEWKA